MPALLGLLKSLAHLVIPMLIQEYYADRARARKEAREAKEKEIDEKVNSASVDALLDESNKRYGPGGVADKAE